jgi:hypothetical protein
MGDGIDSGRSRRSRPLPEVITRGSLSRLSNRDRESVACAHVRDCC